MPSEHERITVLEEAFLKIEDRLDDLASTTKIGQFGTLVGVQPFLGIMQTEELLGAAFKGGVGFSGTVTGKCGGNDRGKKVITLAKGVYNLAVDAAGSECKIKMSIQPLNARQRADIEPVQEVEKEEAAVVTVNVKGLAGAKLTISCSGQRASDDCKFTYDLTN